MEPNRRDAAVHTPYSDGAGVTPSPETTERRRRPKRKASSATLSPSSSGPSKRPAREKVTATVLPPIHNGPLTRARQLSDNAATSSALNAVKNEGSLAVEKEREEVRLARENFEALESAIEAEVDAIRSRDVNVHVVPVPAGWFSWTKVHSIEKQSLPSFFNGKFESRSPQIYIEIRNEIMKKFHANPGVNIESKDLSDLSKGELDARKEVMEFLDYWGLINYHPFPPKDPTSLDANSKLDTDNIDNSENMDSLIDKLYQFDTDQMSSVMVPRPNVSKPGTSMGLFPYSAVAEELGKLKGPSVEYHCNSCSADCSRKRYHCQKQADFDLCTDCYNNGKFGSNMSPSDFILMEPAEASGASGGKWTDQETLLLLEALELFKENWNEIAEHVATKTKAQCILHFLQMPIEDTFLDCDDDEIEDSMPENTGLSSTNDEDASVPKDKAGPSESKTSATEVEPVSTQTETSNPVDGEDQKIDGKVADEKGEDAQNREVVAKAAKEKGDDRQDINVDQVKGDGVVLKALREAFEVVGAPVAFQEKFSFAEAGNPVMALAAFLTRIVDPGIATATAHGSLKSISSSSPGMQLAARHCFILEDPPDDKTEQTGAAAEKNDSDAMEVENEVARNRETENQNADNSRDMEQKNTSSVDKTDSMDNKNHDEKDSTASRENRPVTRELRDRGKKKTRASKRNTQNASHEKVEQNIVNESENPDLKKDVAPNVAKEGDDSGSKVEVSSESVKESGDADASKDLDTKSASIRSSPVAADSVEEVGANIGANRTEDDDKNGDAGSAKIKDDMNVDKLKCAAVTTLAAAAVKAKILANQEEDEIRQLATLLIEKQMRKLEVKLSFFAEMENAILRVREQLDRSRQKLYHERAQIIATRLGLPPNASRSIPPSLPRPQMGVVAQRPPLSNPVTTSGISIPENVPSFRTS